MGTDPRVEALARVLVEYSLELRAGDVLRIRGETTAEPLMREVYRLAARAGAFPFVDATLPGLAEIWLTEAPDESLDWLSPIEQEKVERMTADLVILADSNPYHLAGVDPARQARAQRARRPQIERWIERASGFDPEIRWCATLFPVNAQAQDARMSLPDYEAFVYGAMRVDAPDPVQAWRDFARENGLRRDAVAGADVIRVEAEDTDLTLRVGGRTWVSADGKRNLPDGEVFTGPLEESANGHIRFPHPTVFSGREAEDVRLWFENGVVTRWEARRGKELLDKLFSMDEGARRLGEFAIGTNERIQAVTRNILFDEKIGGTCHFAVGSSIPETGGVNRSSLHWDLICDLRPEAGGGRITADGAVIVENGVWKR